jgi:hypothetical protein
MQVSDEHRRNKPSYTVPFLYIGLEVVLIWIVFSIYEGTLNIMGWGLLSYTLSSVWLLYTLYKLKTVLDRQGKYKH